MKHVELLRYGSIPGMGTFGSLIVTEKPGDGTVLFSCKTVECEDKGNQTFISCIPAGTYPLIKTVHQGRYACWQVTGVEGRWGINIHIANRAVEIQGCIALGVFFGFQEDDWAVADSRVAFVEFMKLMWDGDADIEIIWAAHELPVSKEPGPHNES